MALTAATRVPVITGRGHARMALAHSRGEAGRWTQHAIRYCAARATGRVIAAPAAKLPA